MADTKNMITLGIGAVPGAISWFLLTGLSPDKSSAPGDRAFAVLQEDRVCEIDSEIRVLSITNETRVYPVEL